MERETTFMIGNNIGFTFLAGAHHALEERERLTLEMWNSRTSNTLQ